MSNQVGKFKEHASTAAKEASEEAEVAWDELMIEDTAAQADAPPAGAATSSTGGGAPDARRVAHAPPPSPPEVEAAKAAMGQACLCELASWLGRLVGLLVGVV